MSDTSHKGFGGLLGQRSPLAGHAVVVEPTRDPHEAIARAGLDWTVSKRPLWFTGKANKSKPVKVADRFAVVRDDTEQLLGTVRGGYTPVQNADAFDWAAGLGDFVFAGSLRHDGQVYLGVELERKLDLAGDAASLNLLLWNGHDGSKAVGGMVTPIRLRCTNQLGQARSKAVGNWFARHTSGVLAKAQSRHEELLQLVASHADALERTAARLAGLNLSQERSRQLLEQALPGRVQLVDGVLLNLASTETLDDAQRGTAWGLLQATTEYFEWVRPARTRESALQTTLDGVGARAARALEAAVLEASL